MPPTTAKKRPPKKAQPAKKAVKAKPVEDELDDLDGVEEIETVDSLVAEYDVEKQTPGTYRYKEIYDEGDLPVTMTLYLKKTAVRQLGEPARIRVTFEAVDV